MNRRAVLLIIASVSAVAFGGRVVAAKACEAQTKKKKCKKVGCKWSKKNGCQDSGVATCAGRKKKQCRRPRCKWSKKRGCKETGGGNEGGGDEATPKPTPDPTPDPTPEPTPDPTAAPTADELRAFLVEQLEELQLPGLQVAVVEGGAVTFATGVGYADVERRVPMTADTPTLLASVSKTVTAVALLRVAEAQGRDLDARADLDLGFDLAHPQGGEILVRHLLTHTSGIRDNWRVMNAVKVHYDDGTLGCADADDGAEDAGGFGCSDGYPPYLAEDICGAYDDADFAAAAVCCTCGGGRSVGSDSPVALGDFLASYLVAGGSRYDAEENFYDAAPGEKMKYSNIGSALLGLLVEAWTGEAFDAFCEREIFASLGMTNTHWFLHDFDDVGIVAKPHRLDEDEGRPGRGSSGNFVGIGQRPAVVTIFERF